MQEAFKRYLIVEYEDDAASEEGLDQLEEYLFDLRQEIEARAEEILGRTCRVFFADY